MVLPPWLREMSPLQCAALALPMPCQHCACVHFQDVSGDFPGTAACLTARNWAPVPQGRVCVSEALRQLSHWRPPMQLEVGVEMGGYMGAT